VRRGPGLLLVMIALLGADGLRAQERPCEDTDTIDQCRNRISDKLEAPESPSAEETDASLEEQEASLARKPVGTTALGPTLGSAINDFLPTLAGALGFTPTTTEDGAAAFESNLRIPLGAGLQKVRLQAVLREGELYEPLRAALPEATREERVDALERTLGDFENVRLSLAWNYESRTFGRSFESYRSLYDELFQLERKTFYESEGVSLAKRRVAHEADSVYLAVVSGIDSTGLDSAANCGPFVPRRVTRLELRCFTQDVRDRLEEVIDQAARSTKAVEAELDDQLTRTGFFDLPDLVNNQPQLTAQVNVDIRSELVGPNEVSGTLRYEAGFTNMNGLRRACLRSAGSSLTLDCLRSYTRDPRRQASLKRGDRFFLALSYARRQDYGVTLADDGVTLDLDGTWDFTGELGFGRYVAFNRDGEQIGRIDLSALYVHHQDDPDRENRFVGSVTYTQRVSTSLSLAAGVSYASQPEFLDAVERKVTANFGLRYKLIED
jgi:hypothetical protein